MMTYGNYCISFLFIPWIAYFSFIYFINCFLKEFNYCLILDTIAFYSFFNFFYSFYALLFSLSNSSHSWILFLIFCNNYEITLSIYYLHLTIFSWLKLAKAVGIIALKYTILFIISELLFSSLTKEPLFTNSPFYILLPNSKKFCKESSIDSLLLWE